LHIDGFAWLFPEYCGPAMPTVPEGESIDVWGIRYQQCDYGAGAYNETCYHPLAEAQTIEDLDRFRWPNPDWFSYAPMRQKASDARARQAVKCGYMAPFFLHTLLRGLERALMDPYERPEFTQYLMTRITDYLYEHHARMFEACAGLIDVGDVTDDLGCQAGPIMRMDVFRAFYRPHTERLTGLCREFGLKVFHHDDGGIRPFIPDLIEIGMDILNPIQWTCPGMERIDLKRDFGGKLCFHGGVENQRILAFGTPGEVRAEVRACIDSLGSDGTGYILAPCHNIQPVTTVVNIIAMYDEAHHYGFM
jgi:uroporphyrinogen decarboxylase